MQYWRLLYIGSVDVGGWDGGCPYVLSRTNDMSMSLLICPCQMSLLTTRMSFLRNEGCQKASRPIFGFRNVPLAVSVFSAHPHYVRDGVGYSGSWCSSVLMAPGPRTPGDCSSELLVGTYIQVLIQVQHIEHSLSPQSPCVCTPAGCM